MDDPGIALCIGLTAGSALVVAFEAVYAVNVLIGIREALRGIRDIAERVDRQRRGIG